MASKASLRTPGTAVLEHEVSAGDTCDKTGRVLAFRLSGKKQARPDDLIEKNREGTLTKDESSDRMLWPPP